MLGIWKAAMQHFERGENFALATILAVDGSSPRHPGTRLLVSQAGYTVGTIGGGLFEAQVCRYASEVLSSGNSMRLAFGFKGQDSSSYSEMLCGGDVDVLIEHVSTADSVQEVVFRSIWELVATCSSGLLFSRIDIPAGGRSGLPIPRLLVRSNAGSVGGFQGDTLAVNAAPPVRLMGSSRLLELPGLDHVVYVEWIRSQGTAYIFGAGHVGACVAHLASYVDFGVVVIDDRAEYANPDKIPSAQRLHVVHSFDGALSEFEVDEDSFIVIVTRGHAHDKTVLAQALKTTAGYIGMIGSRRKTSLIYDALLKEGVTKQELERVHAPIGLNIGGETPQEIAVSIVAEMILVRTNRSGRETQGKTR